jgi:hypothetical protein
VHVWLAASSAESRAAWRRSLQRIADLKPLVVVAGHKSRASLPDTPAVIQEMASYLNEFDVQLKASSDAAGLVAAMRRRFPEWTVPGLLRYSAMVSYRDAAKTSSPAAPVTEGPWDPTGTWEFELTTSERPPVTGRIVITGTPARYTGTIAPVTAPEPVVFDSVGVQSRQLALRFVIPGQGPVAMDLTAATRDSLTGKLIGPIGMMDVAARRVR